MSYSTEPGHIGWVDLKAVDASGLRDFYANVAGWRPAPVEMPVHTDFNMNAGDEGDPIAGICPWGEAGSIRFAGRRHPAGATFALGEHGSTPSQE